MLAPGQVDTCDKEMLEETRRVADASGLPIQLHAGQSPAEYRRIQEQHGMSTLQFLSETGLLGDDFMIGHGMYLTQSGIVDQFPPAELGILIESGTTLVHLPWVKARQGAAMRFLWVAFRRAGVRMALGTDSYPFDMVQEMRMAAVMSRVADGSPRSTSSAEIFHAATVAGADALGRPDLGRLKAGAKADIVLVDARKPQRHSSA